MTEALDRLIALIAATGYHNHRGNAHSSELCNYIVEDLSRECDVFREDLASGAVKNYGGFKTPGGRNRRADLVIAEPDPSNHKRPSVEGLRVLVENKSVVTAHRNAQARWSDLDDVVTVLHGKQPMAIAVGTVLIGTAPRYLNVNDGVKKCCKIWHTGKFESDVKHRLSTGDEALWKEFPEHISKNRPGDAQATAVKFNRLPKRRTAETVKPGYDFLLLVPVEIDNVNPPKLAPAGTLGIDAIADYNTMIRQMCQTYRVRFH